MSERVYELHRDKVTARPVHNNEGAPRNLLSREGAQQLAQELDDWWAERGYPQVRHRIEPTRTQRTRSSKEHHIITWCVKSNLVNGLPPRPAPLRRHHNQPARGKQ